MTHNLLLGSLNDASAETIAALRLIRSPGIGPVTYRGVISRFGSACAALDALASRSSTPRKDHIRFTPVPMSQIEDEFLRLKNLGGKLIGIASEAYPRQLAEILDAPPFLTAIGDISHLRRPAIAIVGARMHLLWAGRWPVRLPRT